MLRKLFGKCSWYRRDDDSVQQTEKEQQLFNRFQRTATRIPHSVTDSTLASALTTESSFSVGASNFRQSNTFIKRRTPVLFCTNRGLYLRVPKPTSPDHTENEHSNSDGPAALYDITFCDLERWSTKAYTVCLEDTFTIARRSLETVEEHPTSSSKLHFSNRNSAFSQCYDNNSFMPVKKSSLRFNNAYSRFETDQ